MFAARGPSPRDNRMVTGQRPGRLNSPSQGSHTACSKRADLLRNKERAGEQEQVVFWREEADFSPDLPKWIKRSVYSESGCIWEGGRGSEGEKRRIFLFIALCMSMLVES